MEKVIPLSKVKDNLPINFVGIPYRNDLGVNLDRLTKTIKTLNLGCNIQVVGSRNEPKVNVAPEGNGREDAITTRIAAEEEITKTPPLVRVNNQNKVTITVPYKDKYVKTPKATAEHFSRHIPNAFAQIPRKVYLHNLRDKDSEASIEAATIKNDILYQVGFVAIGSTSVFLLSSDSRPIPLTTLIPVHFLMSFFNIAIIKMLVTNAVCRGVFMRYSNKDMYFAQDIKRCFYPTILTHEVILPSINYAIKRRGIGNLLTTLKPS